MPQITVDYSHPVDDTFDPEGFARALHEATVEIAAASPGGCKTLFRYSDHRAVGYEDPEGHAIFHVTIGLLAGRSDETKARLAQTALDLLGKYVTPQDGVIVHASAEVRDLDASYRKSDL
ncbi:isomerase [Streptomyces fodineus]|uniref:Isomerase n=1 Tax=Streptomyces fodineus TaxID=1904616 RepID=A0A1D7YGS3_9ACTN|nr:isomerase [Streptomyces fodineus]AOR34730.1 isomerase [Streptomyces fodineus]